MYEPDKVLCMGERRKAQNERGILKRNILFLTFVSISRCQPLVTVMGTSQLQNFILFLVVCCILFVFQLYFNEQLCEVVGSYRVVRSYGVCNFVTYIYSVCIGKAKRLMNENESFLLASLFVLSPLLSPLFLLSKGINKHFKALLPALSPLSVFSPLNIIPLYNPTPTTVYPSYSTSHPHLSAF